MTDTEDLLAQLNSLTSNWVLIYPDEREALIQRAIAWIEEHDELTQLRKANRKLISEKGELAKRLAHEKRANYVLSTMIEAVEGRAPS